MLWFQLHRERLAVLDADGRDWDNVWYGYVCRALDSYNLKDRAELRRVIKAMAKYVNVELDSIKIQL